MTKHIPLKEAEATRPDFKQTHFIVSKTPNPDWKYKEGANQLHNGADQKYKDIVPQEVDDKSKLYKLLIGAITPRPIGFTSTVAADGTKNLAPFSYFNVVNHDPPTIMISISNKNKDTPKDTTRNIREKKGFTVNLISEWFVEAANACSVDAPPNVSEWDISGLTPKESVDVEAAWVAESAFSMECTLMHDYDIKKSSGDVACTVILGEIKRFHVREDILKDDGGVDLDKLKPVSRLGGISYGRSTESYELERPQWEKIKDTL
ncbi:flavoprotein oxygenase [Acrasis kona]|uniref:Flavoprotein oxygenase n=1 Tax=Acrasis kona TaxID=1008807 RepID=A0AAW2ZD99_9EUKA